VSSFVRIFSPSSTAQTPLSSLHSGDLTLHFTGENAVHSSVFRLFLEIATTYRVPSAPQSEDKLHLGPLLAFLERWQCDALHTLVLNQVLSQIKNNEMFPLQAFNIGAVTNNLDICKAALREDGWPADWETLDPWYDAGNVHYPWNTRGWSLRLYREHTIPPDFLFALQKAKDLRVGCLGERFAKCLAKAQETTEGNNAVIEK
jgi:hypothetical protein